MMPGTMPGTMRAWSGLAACSALLLLAAPATAQLGSQLGAQPRTSSFGCDTASGRFSQFAIPIQARRFTISGRIKPVLFRTNEQFLPTAVVRIQNPETGTAMAIRLRAPSAEAEGALTTAELWEGGETETAPIGTLALGKLLTFAIIYEQGGQSRIIVGERTITVGADLGADFDLSISCSTSDFVFDQLTWRVGS